MADGALVIVIGAPLPQPGMVFYRVLELAVAHDPVRYRDLIVDPTPKMDLRTRTRGHASLERPPAAMASSPARRALAVKWILQSRVMRD